MSLASTLSHVLGIIKGIHIPGVSIDTTNLLHSVDQTLAERYGAAATKLATELASKVGLSGPDKLFQIVEAMFADAVKAGFKGEADTLRAELVKVAQAAFTASVPSINAKAEALAISLTKNPLAGTVTALVLSAVETKVSAVVGSAAQPPAPAPAPVKPA